MRSEREGSGFRVQGGSIISTLSILSIFRRRAGRARRAFTLVEMMMVIALAATLMAMLASSLVQARNAARRARAEAQLREMVNAFIQYYNTYGVWPPNVSETEARVSEEMLQPLINPDHPENKLKIVFLNKTFTEVERQRSGRLHGGVYYLDPWNEPYRMAFGTVESAGAGTENRITHTTSVWFPNKSRRW